MNFKIKKLYICFMLLMVAAMSASCTETEPVLKDVFAKDFLVGGAVNEDQTYGKPRSEVEVVSKHFNTITPENILKWEGVLTSAVSMSVSSSSLILNIIWNGR